MQLYDKKTAKAFQIIDKNYLDLFNIANKRIDLDPLEISILINRTNLIIRNEVVNRVKKIGKVSYGPSELLALKFFGFPFEDNGMHKKLKNKKVFWALFGYLYMNYQYPSLNIDNILNSTRLHNRQDIDQDERSLLTYYTTIIEEKTSQESNYFIFDSSDKNSINSYFDHKVRKERMMIEEKVQNKINLEHQRCNSNEMIIYRGFDIDFNESVRKDRRKIDNPNYKIQESGIGISYTTDKKIAKEFAIQKFTIDTVNKSTTYSSCTNMRAIDTKISLKSVGLTVNAFSSTANRRCYVASYKTRSDKVLLNLSLYKEREILLNPNDLELIDYKQLLRT